ADLTPAQHTFTLDRTPPVTTFAAIPDNGLPSREVAFSASEPNCTFVCSVDGAPFAACTSPLALSGLGDGEHAVDVRATDRAGNAQQTVATATFVVDTTAPSTTILSGPPAIATVTTATFSFVSSEARSTFKCRLGADPFASCTSPHSVTVSQDGQHTFEVTASDRYGNEDLTPAKFTWTVDALPPTVSITRAPAAFHGAATFAFEFAGNKNNLTFTCALNSQPPAACTSPHSVTGLGEGDHTFHVRATDHANRSADATPANFHVDLTPPVATLSRKPASLSNEASARFEFSANETGSTFECSLDGGTWAACTSPHFETVSDGPHTFAVRAVDRALNRSQPVTAAFTTDLTPPATPALVQPDPSLTDNTTPTLAWNSATDAVSYRFELSTVSDFGQVLQQSTTTDLFYVPTRLPSARYFFRVKAVDAAGNEY
ncbi:MAG: cell envelope biogenesis protein OmpA, partial [Myxococcales bacterium]